MIEFFFIQFYRDLSNKKKENDEFMTKKMSNDFFLILNKFFLSIKLKLIKKIDKLVQIEYQS